MRFNYSRAVKNFVLSKFSFNHIYRPLNAQIELTMRCNAKCAFCSIWTDDFKKGFKNEMTTDQVKTIIDGLEKLGVMVISLTGGEPTLREDLGEIATYIHNKGMMAGMATNGFLLEHKLKKGDYQDFETIMVSLDFPDAERHDANRGIKCFDRAIRGIKLGRKLGKFMLISTVVTKDNINEMEEMCLLAKDLGAIIELLPCEDIIREQDEGAHVVENIDTFVPDLHEYAENIRKLTKKYAHLTTDRFTADIIEAGGFGHQNILRCVVAQSYLMVGYTGELYYPCKIHPIWKPNLLETPIEKIYQSLEAKKIMDMKDDFPFCKGCRLGCAIATSLPTKWGTVYEKYIKAFFNGQLF